MRRRIVDRTKLCKVFPYTCTKWDGTVPNLMEEQHHQNDYRKLSFSFQPT